jgi:Phage integrase family
MPTLLEAMLRDYLAEHWQDNSGRLLFPAPRKAGFARARDKVVPTGLKPILCKLGISDENAGLYAFRHGLATELARTEPITTLQSQMRHADVRTTRKVYAHVIPQSQRESMERIAARSIGTKAPIGTKSAAYVAAGIAVWRKRGSRTQTLDSQLTANDDVAASAKFQLESFGVRTISLQISTVALFQMSS